jgi:hypothetical protein
VEGGGGEEGRGEGNSYWNFKVDILLAQKTIFVHSSIIAESFNFPAVSTV